MKRQKRTIGSIVKIPLGEGYHTYGRILGDGGFAIYDSKTSSDNHDLKEIISKPILFIIAVYNHAVNDGRWEKIGTVALEDSLKKQPKQFIQDALNPHRFSIYDNGKIIPASREECLGLDRAEVWEPELVEERINDHYAGRQNRWAKELRL